MKKTLFDELLKGVREMKEIRQGRVKPARVTKLSANPSRALGAQGPG